MIELICKLIDRAELVNRYRNTFLKHQLRNPVYNIHAHDIRASPSLSIFPPPPSDFHLVEAIDDTK